MNIADKQKILHYLERHDDNSAISKEIIKLMEYECHYADVDCFSICEDDIDSLDDGARAKLEQFFGKSINELSVEDYQTLADEMADDVCEDFGEHLYNTIEYLKK